MDKVSLEELKVDVASLEHKEASTHNWAAFEAVRPYELAQATKSQPSEQSSELSHGPTHAMAAAVEAPQSGPAQKHSATPTVAVESIAPATKPEPTNVESPALTHDPISNEKPGAVANIQPPSGEKAQLQAAIEEIAVMPSVVIADVQAKVELPSNRQLPSDSHLPVKQSTVANTAALPGETAQITPPSAPQAARHLDQAAPLVVSAESPVKNVVQTSVHSVAAPFHAPSGEQAQIQPAQSRETLETAGPVILQTKASEVLSAPTPFKADAPITAILPSNFQLPSYSDLPIRQLAVANSAVNSGEVAQIVPQAASQPARNQELSAPVAVTAESPVKDVRQTEVHSVVAPIQALSGEQAQIQPAQSRETLETARPLILQSTASDISLAPTSLKADAPTELVLPSNLQLPSDSQLPVKQLAVVNTAIIAGEAAQIAAQPVPQAFRNQDLATPAAVATEPLATKPLAKEQAQYQPIASEVSLAPSGLKADAEAKPVLVSNRQSPSDSELPVKLYPATPVAAAVESSVRQVREIELQPVVATTQPPSEEKAQLQSVQITERLAIATPVTVQAAVKDVLLASSGVKFDAPAKLQLPVSHDLPVTYVLPADNQLAVDVAQTPSTIQNHQFAPVRTKTEEPGQKSFETVVASQTKVIAWEVPADIQPVRATVFGAAPAVETVLVSSAISAISAISATPATPQPLSESVPAVLDKQYHREASPIVALAPAFSFPVVLRSDAPPINLTSSAVPLFDRPLVAPVLASVPAFARESVFSQGQKPHKSLREEVKSFPYPLTNQGIEQILSAASIVVGRASALPEFKSPEITSEIPSQITTESTTESTTEITTEQMQEQEGGYVDALASSKRLDLEQGKLLVATFLLKDNEAELIQLFDKAPRKNNVAALIKHGARIARRLDDKNLSELVIAEQNDDSEITARIDIEQPSVVSNPADATIFNQKTPVVSLFSAVPVLSSQVQSTKTTYEDALRIKLLLDDSARRNRSRIALRKPPFQKPVQAKSDKSMKVDLQKRRIYRIVDEDTLELIGEKIFVQKGLADLIYTINRGFFKESKGSKKSVIKLEFITDTIIFLPTDEEIARFIVARKGSTKAALEFEYERIASTVSLRQRVSENLVEKAAEAQSKTSQVEAGTVKTLKATGVKKVKKTRKDVQNPVYLDDVERFIGASSTIELQSYEAISRIVYEESKEIECLRVCTARMEVLCQSQWRTVMEYKIADGASCLVVYRMSGASHSIPVDLPVDILKDMAVSDMQKNRLRYSKKYLLGKKIFV